MEIKVAITTPSPAFNPSIEIATEKPSSTVCGMVNSETVIFSGIANFITFAIAFIENKIKTTIETILACFFKLGNRFRIPRPKIAPWNNPTNIVIPNVIRKFSSAIASKSKIFF